MSAAAIAAMAIVADEEHRRRTNPDYQPFCSVGDLIECHWAGPAILLIAVGFCAAMMWITFN